MGIWFKKPNLKDVNSSCENTIIRHLGIDITAIGDDYVEGTMPTDKRTHQSYKRVHGGANVVLAETLASVGSSLTLNPVEYFCVGQEVNANHLRGVTTGLVTGRAE